MKSVFKAKSLTKKSSKADAESELRGSLKEQAGKDLGKKGKVKEFAGGYSPNKAINIILKYDNYIDDVSKGYGVNKALIQSLLFRELICYDALDVAADKAVMEYFSYKQRLEDYKKTKWYIQILTGAPTPNGMMREDCSTGLGQIFARTAIGAINYGITNKKLMFDADNWKVRRQIWNSLHNDDEYTVRTIAKILIKEADGINKINLKSPKSNHAKLVLARYNLSGRKKAGNYGKSCYRYYKLFKKYNKAVK